VFIKKQTGEPTSMRLASAVSHNFVICPAKSCMSRNIRLTGHVTADSWQCVRSPSTQFTQSYPKCAVRQQANERFRKVAISVRDIMNILGHKTTRHLIFSRVRPVFIALYYVSKLK
jgi:hypothetical protein